MSANNWTVCPSCVKRSKALRGAFVEKYYGKLDSFVYNKMLEEINYAVEHIESYSSNERKPDEEILTLMHEKEIKVSYKGNEYGAGEVLQNHQVSCSLREDYEQGVGDEGHAFWIYGCHCDCGFSKNFRFEEEKHKIVDK